MRIYRIVNIQMHQSWFIKLIFTCLIGHGLITHQNQPYQHHDTKTENTPFLSHWLRFLGNTYLLRLGIQLATTFKIVWLRVGHGAFRIIRAVSFHSL